MENLESMLKKRILTAIISLPLLFAVLYFFPRPLVFLIFLLVALGTTLETAQILLPALRTKLGVPYKGSYNFWLAFCVLNSGILFSCLAFRMNGMELSIAIFSIVVLLLFANFLSSSIDAAIANMLGTLFSVVYGALPWISALDLYEMGAQARFLFLLLGIVMANDSAAYFVGKYLGKHPLAPQYSPKKTWEGALGGLAGGILGAWLINVFFFSALGSWSFLAVAAVLTGVAGILGDLTESVLKRFGGVKDSGVLFPGHGGLLDRTDSIIFAAPVLWFVIYVSNLNLDLF